MIKRILSLLLVLLMMVSMFPVGVVAEGAQGDAQTAAEAVTAETLIHTEPAPALDVQEAPDTEPTTEPVVTTCAVCGEDPCICTVWDTVDAGTEITLLGFLDKSKENIEIFDDLLNVQTLSAAQYPDYLILNLVYSDLAAGTPAIYAVDTFDADFYENVISYGYCNIGADAFAAVVPFAGLYATVGGQGQADLYGQLDVATSAVSVDVAQIAGEYAVADFNYDYSDTGNWYFQLVPGQNWPAQAEQCHWISADFITGLSRTATARPACPICGTPGCTSQHPNWCAICRKDDCGFDHSVPSVSDTVIDANGNEQTVTVSGEALPEGAKLTVSEVIANPDGGFTYDIKIWDANGNEWQPGNGETVRVTMPVTGAEDGSTIDIVHILENEQLILDAVEKGNVLDGDGIETTLSAAAQAYKNAVGEDGAVAYEAILGLVVENSCVSFDVSSFSIYTWNGSYVASSAGANNKIVMRKNAATDGANGDTYYVTNNHSIYMDRGGYTPTGISWSTSNSSIGSFSGSNTDKYFNLNGTASLGTTFTITHSVRTDWAGGKTSTITIVIVEERTVNFNANGGSCSTASAKAITDGGSHNQNITLPNATRTGYTFNGWYSAASGGTKIGNAGAAYMPGSSGGTLYAQWTPIKYTVKFNPNTANAGNGTVTGTMPTLEMTYDVETTLPKCQYINSADGYVFLGWATSATGDVVHRDGAAVKNLASTNTTVTLYAKWQYALNSVIYIGINNSYHNPKGNYTSGGVTINSYHAFPNEPAQMHADFDRVTDDKGGWRYDKESAVPLKNTAENYINGSIFNHAEYGMTKVQGENTMGLADPEGTKVKAMLKFTEAEYNQMISVWLEGMRNTLIGYGDPNMDWANAKADDFVMVPYVIKLQNYNSWYIDMAVVQKNQYTLGYNNNIENGYTITFNGVAFPPSAQYHDGDVVPVVLTPIGYQNNNLKVTKVVNGITYTAKFLYWEDEQGIKYGTGYNTTVTMNANKTLKAVWEYPDQTEGALRVEKEVTVPLNSGLKPDTNKSFNIKVELGASKNYSYTKYGANGLASGSGSFSGTTQTFALKDGEYVVITGINHGTKYTVSETAPTGYTNKSNTITGTIQAGNIMSATIVNEPSSYSLSFDFNGGTNANTSVTVVYGSTNYYDVSWLNPTREGHEFAGWYTAATNGTQVYGKNGICLSGSYWNSSRQWIGTSNLTVYAHWTAQKHDVTGTIDNNGIVTNGSQTVNYGENSSAMVFAPADGYVISGITVTVNGTTQTVEVTDSNRNGYTYASQKVTGPISVNVTTEKKTYSVTGTIDNLGNVTNGSQTVKHGENSSAMTFTPATGYKITGIKVNGNVQTVANENSYVYPAQSNVTDRIKVEVTTGLKTYAVTGTINNNGTVVGGNQTVKHGENSSAMTFTPATGYEINGITVTVNGVAQTVEVTDSNRNGYTYASQTVTGPVSVNVTTAKKTYSVAGTIDNGGSVTNGSQTVNHGESSSEMVFTPAAGYEINGITITVNGTTQTVTVTDSNKNGYTYQATNVTAPVSVAVTTAIKTHTVTGTIDNGGEVTNTPQDVEHGKTNTTMLFTPAEGYEIVGVTVNGETILTFRPDQYSFTKTISEDTTVVVTTAKKVFTITWKNDDGSTIDTTKVEYGEMPTHTAPSKASTAEYSYSFTGWSPALAAATDNATYTATYTATKRGYTVTWMNEDGTVLETDTNVPYGTMPSYDGAEPTKAPDDRYTYTFDGWGSNISAVTGDAVYIASFTPHENYYTVQWVNYDGRVLETDERVAWGTMPSYDGATPQKPGNAEHGYTFIGWSPNVSKVKGNATYTALFEESVNAYTVTWLNADGTVLETDENVPYGATPSYDGETPEMESTPEYTYSFDKWTPEVVTVTEDATYTATFTETKNKYNVTFVDEDGTVLKEAVSYEYGTAAEDIVKPDDPEKDATPEYTYTFDGWDPDIADVTEDATYTATYTKVKNKYTMSGVIEHGTVSDPQTVEYGEYAKLSFKADTGYRMTGWHRSNPETTSDFTSPTQSSWEYGMENMTSDVTITVFTAPIDYTITLELNGGALPEDTEIPTSYNVESDDITLPEPTRYGYTFMGWTEDRNALTGEVECVIPKGTTGNKTYYATWELAIADLTIKAITADTNQNFIFTVTGGDIELDVVVLGGSSVVIKNLPINVYTVKEKDTWSWRESTVADKTADLSVEAQRTVTFDFGQVNKTRWLSGYSYWKGGG